MSWIDRLRTGELIAPSGISMKFQTDSVEREGGKKASINELIDSNFSIAQDQGNLTYSYPVSAYFTGADYDKEVDKFVKLLEERYSRQLPGRLKHPRWGNFDVMPFKWKQSEQLVKGRQIGRIEIEFREVVAFPMALPDFLENILALLEAVATATALLARALDFSRYTLISSAIARVNNAVDAITSNLRRIANAPASLADSITTLTDDTSSSTDDIASSGGDTEVEADAAEDMVLNVQTMIGLSTTPETITSENVDIANETSEELLTALYDDNETDISIQTNNALLTECFGGYSVCIAAQIAAQATYETQSQAISAADNLIALLQTYLAQLETIRVEGNAETEYSGDYNTTNIIIQIVSYAISYILNNSFDLATEKRYTLTHASDAITECYAGYGNVQTETLTKFILTNKLSHDEFEELPEGREIVIYA